MCRISFSTGVPSRLLFIHAEQHFRLVVHGYDTSFAVNRYQDVGHPPQNGPHLLL